MNARGPAGCSGKHGWFRAFAVYDATRIPDGPVAKIWLDHHVPITFHGTFLKQTL